MTNPSGVGGYYVYRDASKVANVPGAANTTYTDTGLAANTSYNYNVSAYDNAGNESALSGSVGATTQPTTPTSGAYPRYGAYGISNYGIDGGYYSPAVAERLSRCQVVILSAWVQDQAWSNAYYASYRNFVQDIKDRSVAKGNNTKVIQYMNFNEETGQYSTAVQVDQLNNWYLYEHGTGTGLPPPPGQGSGAFGNVVWSTWDYPAHPIALINMTHYSPKYQGLWPYQWFAKWSYDTMFNNLLGYAKGAPNLDGFFVDNGFLYPRTNGQPYDISRQNIPLSWPDQIKSAWSQGIADFMIYGRSLNANTLWGCNSPYDAFENNNYTGSGTYNYLNTLDNGLMEFAIGNDSDYGTAHTNPTPSFEYYVGTETVIKTINAGQTYLFRNGAASYAVIDVCGLDNLGTFAPSLYGSQTNYQALRYSLGLVSMTDGYFYDDLNHLPGILYDKNTDYNIRLWDEVIGGSLNRFGWLGQATDERQNSTRFYGTVWARRFANGAVFLNTRGASAQNINLSNPFGDGVIYQRLTGTQRPDINNGAVGGVYNLPGGDAIFVRKYTVYAQSNDTIAPSIPTNVTAIGTATNAITITWSASTDTGVNASGVAGYNIYRTGTSTKLNTNPITGTSYVDSGLSSGASYSYRVSAVDNASNESATSTTVSATTQTSTINSRIWTGNTIGGTRWDWGSTTYKNFSAKCHRSLWSPQYYFQENTVDSGLGTAYDWTAYIKNLNPDWEGMWYSDSTGFQLTAWQNILISNFSTSPQGWLVWDDRTTVNGQPNPNYGGAICWSDPRSSTTGLPGAWKGPWSITTSYVTNDVVFYNNRTFIALQNSTGRIPTGDAYWAWQPACQPIPTYASTRTDVSGAHPTFYIWDYDAVIRFDQFIGGGSLGFTTDGLAANRLCRSSYWDDIFTNPWQPGQWKTGSTWGTGTNGVFTAMRAGQAAAWDKFRTVVAARTDGGNPNALVAYNGSNLLDNAGDLITEFVGKGDFIHMQFITCYDSPFNPPPPGGSLGRNFGSNSDPDSFIRRYNDRIVPLLTATGFIGWEHSIDTINDPIWKKRLRYGSTMCFVLSNGLYGGYDGNYQPASDSVLWMGYYDVNPVTGQATAASVAASRANGKASTRDFSFSAKGFSWLGQWIDGPQTAPYQNGVYVRRATNGYVVCNPPDTGGARYITLTEKVKRVYSSDDPTMDGTVYNPGDHIPIDAIDGTYLVKWA